jgi:hypothetical protein
MMDESIFYSDHIYALEVQSNFSNEIINGRKTIETRDYPLPVSLINQPILLLESQHVHGQEGISALPDIITPDVVKNKYNLSIIGIIYISECFQYTTEGQWDTDRVKHLVPLDSNYNWSPDSNKSKYGWCIAIVDKYDSSTSTTATSSICIPNHMVRVYRSLFDCGLKSDLQQVYTLRK